MPAIRSESIGVSTSAVPPASPFPPSPPHPSALHVLCTVELFERVTSGVLTSLLALYLNERFGLSAGASSQASGYFHALGYAGCVAGGLLADRWLGDRHAVSLGCAMLGAGFLAMGLDAHAALWPALGLLIVGSALFKPSLLALVRHAYPPGDSRAGDGFVWFYFAANVGAVLGAPMAAALRPRFGWGGVFLACAAAMMLAGLALGVGRRHLRAQLGAEHGPAASPATAPIASGLRWRAAIVVLCAFVAAAVAFAQLTGPLMFWARDFTQRALWGVVVPPDVFGSVPAVIAIAVTPLMPRLWAVLGRRGFAPSEARKLGVGLLLCSLSFALMVPAALRAAGPVSPAWLLSCKFTLTLGEVLVWPVTTSLVARFAPPRLVAASVGLLYVLSAIGFALGGAVAGLWTRMPAAHYFGLFALALGAAALLYALTARHITRALAAVAAVPHA